MTKNEDKKMTDTNFEDFKKKVEQSMEPLETPTAFQQATIDHVMKRFNEEQKRFLVADEVGLGKTIVAQHIISELFKKKQNNWNKEKKKNPRKRKKGFHVVYICSNQEIADQNIKDLAKALPVSEKSKNKKDSRVSQDRLTLINDESGSDRLYTMTPETSLKVNSAGRKEERNAFCKERRIRNIHTRVRERLQKWIEKNGKYFQKWRKEKIKKNLKRLNPDLIIMDEFQNFEEILNPLKTQEKSDNTDKIRQSKEDETDEIEEDDSCSDKNADAACFEIMETMANYKILFLSATPFRMFNTEEEDAAQSKAREGLLKVIEILGGNKTEAENILNRNDKKELEEYLLQFMCRTERRETDLFTKDKREELIPTVPELKAYFDLEKKSKSGFPVEYIKSTPFPLSFMCNNYEISKQILAKQNSITSDNSLTFTEVENYTLDVNQIHSRLACLNKYAFGNDEKGKISDVADYLLWLPPSYPAYAYDCHKGAGKYFSEAKDYSKVLVFSRWQMVPKMIAAMVSYQAEKILQSKKGKKGTYFSEHSKVIDEDHFFLDSTKELAEKELAEKKLDLTEELAKIEIPFYQNSSLKKLRNLVKTKIKKMNLSLSIRGMKKDVELDILTNMAIGSPAVCLKRRGMDDKKIIDIIDAFITYFNKRSSQQVLKKIYGKAGYREVFKYCAEGNMQAVIDEYLSTLSNNLNNFCVGLQDNNVAIKWNEPKGDWRKKMRSHFAMGFYTSGKRGKATECERLTELRKAFNSPFRPFVLATTSCGQEGLDFHQYCRRIMHWNLPSNPIDFEQREGRINRYRNLAVRQSLCKDWREGNPFENGDVFKTNKKDNKGGLIPDWGLDENASVKIERIERILPFYAYSTEWNDYDALKTALKYYRATIGKPKQTELVKQMAENNKRPEDVALNLSPIHRSKQKKS